MDPIQGVSINTFKIKITKQYQILCRIIILMNNHTVLTPYNWPAFLADSCLNILNTCLHMH